MLKKAFFSCAIFSFFLLISLGNFFRFLENSLFSDNLIVSEALLYFFSLASLFFLSISKKALLRFFTLTSCVMCSFFYGCFLLEFDPRAGLYAVRLIFYFVTSYSLASIFYERFQGALHLLCGFFFKAYAIALILGAVLYTVFPSSNLLWDLLNSYHIGFRGDPHVGRFVSVYFDPNYYASISGFAFLVSSYLYFVTEKKMYRWGGYAFFLSGVLTWSRSGIAVLVALILYKALPFLLEGRFRKKEAVLFIFTLSLCFFAGLFYREELGVFMDRTLHFFEESSALCRLETFRLGLDLLAKFPLFGLGIGFLYQYTQKEVSLSSLDSSLLSLLVQIGIVPFCLLLIYGLYKSFVLFKMKDFHSPFLSWLIFYLITVGLFASQFNNILFYPFWLLPLLTTCIFIIRSGEVKKSSLSVRA